MNRAVAILATLGLLGAGAATAAERLPQVLATSRTDAAVVLGADIARVETTDQLPLYRVTLNFARGVSGLLIEYEVRTTTGGAAGGGMFTIRPQMLSADSKHLEFLSGFSGIALGPGNTIVLRLTKAPSAPEPKRPSSSHSVIAPIEVVDSCPTSCEQCSIQAKALCEGGSVQNYNCACGGEKRTCSLTCAQR